MSQLLELSTCQCLHQVLRYTSHRHDVWQVDLCRGRRRQLDLGLLSSLLQTLHGHRITLQVCAFVILELLYQPVNDHLVEVITTEVGITIGREHLEHATTKLQDRDIERTTTEVEHGDLHILVGLIHTVSQSGGCRLVHDTLHIQTGNLTSLLGSLTLRVREVGRHSDHSLCHLLSEIVLGSLLHLLQHHGRDFLRGVLTTVDVHTGITTLIHNRIRHAVDFLLGLLPVLTHKTLDRINGVLRVRDGLTLGRVTDLSLTILNKTND